MLVTGAWRVRRVAETGSTNADLMAAARAGEAAGAVLVADHQRAGRGRLGRSWAAPPGASLLVSVLVRPPLPVEQVHQVTQAMALAAVAACIDVAGVTPEIKWPNDLLLGERKLAGILAESVIEAGRVEAVVVGMGLNVNWPSPSPVEHAVALNHLTGGRVDRDVLLDALLAHLRTVDVARYASQLATLGRPVRVELADRVLTGTAIAVDDDGALVVRTRTGTERVRAGDVIHLR